MTERQYRHFRAYLARILGRNDFTLLGGREMILIALPGVTYFLAPREREPVCFRNRYFTLNCSGAAAFRAHEGALRALNAATETYARRFPWLVRSVRDGRVFLENTPAALDALSSRPNEYQALFDELAKLRRENKAGKDPLKDLYDLDALQSLVFEIASATSHRSLETSPDSLAPLRRPLPAPAGRPLLFINLLRNTGSLPEELELWVARLKRDHHDVRYTSNWREAKRCMNRRAIVFCFGVREDKSREECVPFLLKHAAAFGRLVFVDVGVAYPRISMAKPPLPPNVSIHLASPKNFFCPLWPSLPAKNRIPYLPVVSRRILAHRLPVKPAYDFFVCSNGELDLEFMFRHRPFFARHKILLGTKGTPMNILRRVRRCFPQTVFIPKVSLPLYIKLWQLARHIVIMCPKDRENTSFTLSTALLSGRGIITTAHRSIAQIDPGCFLFYRPGTRGAGRELERMCADERRSRTAVKNAERFARRRLEFSRIIEDIVRRALRR